LRIVHLSDTHLGFSAYSRIDPTDGVNLREKDFYNAFRQAVDKTIALKPDAVVHAGDLFDVPRPTNRAIVFAQEQLIRLSEAGIETVLISGNHSTPRLSESANIFRIFEPWKHIHPLHAPGIQTVVVGDITVRAAPHSSDPPLSRIATEMHLSRETKYNVAVLHIGVIDPKNRYMMDEFNEQSVRKEDLPEGFDHVALGHFHGAKEFPEANAWYSGSTERLSITEHEQEKVILEVDLEKRKVTKHPLEVRQMIDLPKVDAKGMTATEVFNAARERVSSKDITDRIVRLVVEDVPGEAYRALDAAAIRRLGRSAMHFDLLIERSEATAKKEAESAKIGSLPHEFERFVSGLDAPEARKKMLMERGLQFFARGEE
jgi:DNA repair exonuclease SbcCD nuclease subunit